MELGRRLAVEKELERLSLEAVKEGRMGTTANVGNPTWDETGKFVIYPTLLGIKGELSAVFLPPSQGRRDKAALTTDALCICE